MAKYTPKTKDELKKLVQDENIYLGDINTSNIIDMERLFFMSKRRDFSGIDSWDTSKVVDMSYMFCNVKSFNENINSWDTSNVVCMCGMFSSAESFNQPLDKWDTSNVVDMTDMFRDSKSFNQNIDSWNVGSVKSNVSIIGNMFKGSNMDSLPIWWSDKKNDWIEERKIRNASIQKGIVGYVKKDMQSGKYVPKTKKELWALCYDNNISLGDIDTSNIVDMNGIFSNAERVDYSGIDSWDTSKVVDMSYMFCNAKFFNENINSWDTSNVVSMYGMFYDTKSFNQPLDSWDTSSVEFMTRMFKKAKSFNQNINSWDVSSVRDNQEMFWDSGVSKLPKWYKKRAVVDVDDVWTMVLECIFELLMNPRPKKPKIAPQDKQKSNRANDWGSLRQNYDLSKLSLKSKIAIAFSILFVVAICFNVFKSMLSDSDTKTQPTQTTQPKQTQPAQQPTQNTLRCDDRDLLNHIIKSYKDFLVYAFEQDTESFSKMQEDYRQAGINLTSAEELINSFKHNITNVRTKSSDEVNKQIVCEVEVEEIYPIPQYKPYYGIVDYRAQLTNDNSIGFEILDTRTANK